MRNFKIIYGNELSHDSAILTREFSGRMTDRRMSILQNWAKKNTWRIHCGHEYDCCGCNFEQNAEINYQAGQVVITVVKHYNY